ncbi:hypothetical protein [Ruminiclostridium hungatei]|uniref:hypothetical protein n=1 Tax=Ruminiclostridium hungatei TaxID=48256 RepID=UPI0010554E23|nr:hypothetical protein [Ruminiclostridium hungatei]
MDKNSGISLLNAAAKEYPTYTDPISMKSLTEPTATNWTKVSSPISSLTSSQLSAFRTWYQNTYWDGQAIDLSTREVHHINILYMVSLV